MAKKPKKKIVIDFNTKFISPSKSIWTIFPGEGYKFYQAFLENGVVFADLPGFTLKGLDLNDDEALKVQICISEKVRSFHLERKQEAPSRDPNDYKKEHWTGKRTNTKGVINGLFGKAKKGDLVLMTSRGGGWGTTHIGEFTHSASAAINTTFPTYGRERIPARQVKWLGTIDNNIIGEDLWRQLASPNAFTALGKSHHELIYQNAYGNYIRTDAASSMFDIKSEDFSTLPDMYLKFIANFSAEVVRNIEEGSLDEFMNKDVLDWFFDIQESEYVPTQQININSPGKNLLRSVTHSPILAVVIFALCLHPASVLKAAELEFKNSANGGVLDECDIPVVENAQIAFQMMSLEKLEKLCKAADKAKNMGQIQTPITTKVVDQ